MLLRAAALLVALACSCIPARAADVPPAAWKYDNPFCGVIASVAPLGNSGRYGLALFAQQGTTLSAHVTLVSDTDAYDAAVPDTNLSGPITDRQMEPVVVTLPVKDAVRYYFVDSYAADRGTSVSCPSYVFPVDHPIADAPSDVASVEAKHLQSLGKPACGAMYRPPGGGSNDLGVIGHFGNRPLSTEYRVFIDSNGRDVGQKLVASSGVDALDAAARGNLQDHQYVPARFLCTPVVGEMDIRMDYDP
ncbi:MAG TPA: hypothetical protein VFE16_11780 [Candidatus Cybelea sp.]|jgi:hypothetical protein|nr:hypothetical protein [Candidatus Cybelea sp.]